MPPKRAKRAAAVKATQAIEADIAGNSEDELEDNPINNKLILKKPIISSLSRIRYAEDTPAKTKRVNKGKRSAGKLKQLKDMPLDIFFEIVSWLHPLDLLQLSRVSKYLREMFMSKSSKVLWVRARNKLKMPDCPESINEAQYASLVFENTCQACGVGRASKVDFGYLVRLCGACHKENILNGKRLFRLFPKDLDRTIFLLMPPACGEESRSNPPSLTENTSCDRYYKPHFEAIAERLLALKPDPVAYDSFIHEMIEKAVKMNNFNYTMYGWMEKQSREKAQAEIDCKAEREANIKAKLIEMGYNEEDFPQGYVYDWHNCLFQPRPLTPRIWNQIKGKMVACLEREKQKRRDELIRQRKNNLSTKLKPHYNTFVAQLKENEDELHLWFPILQHALKIPAVDTILSQDDYAIELTPERVQEVLDIVKADVILTRDRTEAKLLSQLRDVYACDADGSEVEHPETLDRKYLYFATSFFQCPCGCCSSGSSIHTFTEILGHVWHHSKSEIKVNVSASRTARKVIRILDFPEEHLAKDVPHRYICDCLHPKLEMPLKFEELVSHITDDRVWHTEMTDNLNAQRDPSLVLHDDHDLDSPTFIHVHTPDTDIPQFDFNDCQWKPEGIRRARDGYGCAECVQLSSAATKHVRRPLYTFRYDRSHPNGPHKAFIHHVKTKHQRDPCEEDVVYVSYRL
ncbi:hypothetical protein QCA50_015138 [Cerrena zonata]|uniref:F-box domain-containing protein n=1 Tax=Cerrena zonata TaxID=2478898 RepID=A0AAW0FLX9_9APHY